MLQKICEICQEEFSARRQMEKYCGQDCYKEARRRQARTPEQRARKARNKQDQRDRDPEKQREILKKSRIKHKEKRNAECREWNQNHREHKRQYTRQYRAKNPEKRRLEQVLYYQSHKEQIAARTLAWQRSNPTVMQARNARRRAWHANAEGSWTKEQFKELCESADYHCSYCHKRFDKLTPDHMTPLSRGGSNDITNITPACLSCNASKQDKTVLEFISYIKIF